MFVKICHWMKLNVLIEVFVFIFSWIIPPKFTRQSKVWMIFACMLVMLATCVATDFMMQLCREFNCVGILLNRTKNTFEEAAPSRHSICGYLHAGCWSSMANNYNYSPNFLIYLSCKWWASKNQEKKKNCKTKSVNSNDHLQI